MATSEDDELYERFGHDPRYLDDDAPYRDPNRSSYAGGAGRLAAGLAGNPRAGRQVRLMLLWLGGIVAVAVVLCLIAWWVS